MPIRKQIQPGEKLPLKLTAAERALLLAELLCLDPAIEQVIKDTPTSRPVMLTLDELEDLGGNVAAQANHCEDRKKQKKLDVIFEKTEALLVTFTHDEPLSDVAKYLVDCLTSKTAGSAAPKSSKKSTNKSKSKSPAASDKLFQFKITLLGSKPAIWRRIQVHDCTLDKLHEHIQTAMGWTNSHLHQFNIKGQYYGDPELLQDIECIDSTQTMISQILPKAGKRFAFKYEYDFGDSWEHEILFEGNPTAVKAKKYPLCLEGERACPPEDIGGIWGYYDFIQAMADPKHEEHERYLEWYGEQFSTDQFDPAQATRQMTKGLPNWRTM
jgi:hypothetical protein